MMSLVSKQQGMQMRSGADAFVVGAAREDVSKVVLLSANDERRQAALDEPDSCAPSRTLETGVPRLDATAATNLSSWLKQMSSRHGGPRSKGRPCIENRKRG